MVSVMWQPSKAGEADAAAGHCHALGGWGQTSVAEVKYVPRHELSVWWLAAPWGHLGQTQAERARGWKGFPTQAP